MMEFFRKWNGTVLHSLATLMVAVVSNSFFLVVVVSLFFLLREIWQDFQKGYRWPVWPVRRSPIKDLEGFLPLVIGLLGLLL